MRREKAGCATGNSRKAAIKNRAIKDFGRFSRYVFEQSIFSYSVDNKLITGYRVIHFDPRVFANLF